MRVKRYKFLLFFLIMVLASSFLTGCFLREAVVEEIIHLSFADAVSFEQIKMLDGQLVSIIGFMSTTSPLDGSFIYLQNMPYQSCPFCLPNTNILVNTIAVYAPSGQSFRFMDVPILVTGRIVVEEMTDDLGFAYNYRIVDAKIEKAEVSGLGRYIRIYTELVDQGFARVFISVFEDLDKVLFPEKYDLTREDIEPMDMSKMEELKNMFIGLNIEEDHKDIYGVVNRLQELLETLNSMITDGQWDLLPLLDDEAEEIWQDFAYWLLRPSI